MDLNSWNAINGYRCRLYEGGEKYTPPSRTASARLAIETAPADGSLTAEETERSK